MKKTIYVVGWVMLMLILSFILHAGIEIYLLNRAQRLGQEIIWVQIWGQAVCALPWWFIISLPVVFAGIGIYLGFFFWQKVYVEHLHQK